jgi:hypothetical protein
MFQLLGWLGHFLGDREGIDAWLLRWVAVVTGPFDVLRAVERPAFLNISKGTRWTGGRVTRRLATKAEESELLLSRRFENIETNSTICGSENLEQLGVPPARQNLGSGVLGE